MRRRRGAACSGQVGIIGDSRRAIAGALGVLLGLAACGTVAAEPDDDPRAAAYDAAFERYYAPGEHDLVVDLDLQARFVSPGSDVVYRRGRQRAGEILLARPQDGTTRVLVDEPSLGAALRAAGAPDAGGPMRIIHYLPERELLVVAWNDEAGQWAFDLSTGRAVPYKAEGPPKELISPDGRSALFVRDYNLWLRAGGATLALTEDGNYDRRYAINYPRFGQQVEAGDELPPMNIEAAWSDDSRYVLTYRLDRNGSTIHEGVQNRPPGGGAPRRFRYVYPNAGEANVPLLQPVLVDAKTRTVRDLDLPVQQQLFPVAPSLSWAGGRVYYEWSARGFGETRLYEADPATGSAKLRLREALLPNVTVTSTIIRPMGDRGEILLVSERSGWAQLYLVSDRDGPEAGRRLTVGEWEITAISHASDKGVLIIGKGREAGENPYYEHLYRVGLDGSLVRLTPEALHHQVEVSKDGQWFIDRMSSPTEPTRTLLRSTRDGAVVLELGRADPSALLADGFTPPEVFQGLSADGKAVLYGMIYRPRNFDASRRYPVIEHVYTGPTLHRFRSDYAGAIGGMASALTQLGAIVATVDAPGTAGRGREFRIRAYQNLHKVGIEDHVAMLRQMQARYPYMDIDRGVGVIGGSSGAYDTFRFMVRRPDVYVAGAAHAGNHQLRMVKALWPEIHMGFPDESVWAENSSATYADQLQGRLLLTHGDIDDNVPVATTYALSEALRRAGKPHELLIRPNAGHSVRTPAFHHAVRRFFLAELIDRKRK